MPQPAKASSPIRNSFVSPPTAEPSVIRAKGDRSLALNPFNYQATLRGSYLSSYPIPDAFETDQESASETQSGIRNNLALEGSSFSPDGNTYFTIPSRL